MTQPWGGEGGGTVVVRYEYDVQDHLVKVVDGNGTVTTYEHSDRDLLTMELSEVTGVTTYAYDELGQVIRETDARDVTVKRQYDVLGRLRFVDYPERDLDTMYDWDDKSVPFSKGRMTAIRRNRESVDYRYDRFGRMTQDGALTYGYDKNGNRTTIGYPGGVTASYTYDYADREATLIFRDGEAPPQMLVTSASYKPFGPLTSLSLGNGLVESRTYTTRYHPLTIDLPDFLSWNFQTDGVGNVRAITDNLNSGASRLFSYQDYQYYLTGGVGPWGDLSWIYDKIGNPLIETHNGITRAYIYRLNAAGGNSPQLARLNLNGEPRPIRYYYDSTGSLTNVATARSLARFDYNPAGRIAEIRSETAGRPGRLTKLRYDGRNLLTSSTLKPDLAVTRDSSETHPIYSSRGVLYYRLRNTASMADSPRSSPSTAHALSFFYLAGRPVAQLAKTSPGPPKGSSAAVLELTFITADHLGTPVVITDQSREVIWAGSFEPFGGSYGAEPDDDASPLRLPGQWNDETWKVLSSGSTIYYNVHRWYNSLTGRYLTPDPAGLQSGEINPYTYARNNPISSSDPLGLFTVAPGAPACLEEYVKNQLPKLAGHATIPKNLSVAAQAPISTVISGFAWGSGPEIVVTDLAERPGYIKGGQFRAASPSQIFLQKKYVEQLCRCPCDDAVIGLGITILHEYAHQLYFTHNGLEFRIERGKLFTDMTYDRPDFVRYWGQYTLGCL